jgi:hypothetical protein
MFPNVSTTYDPALPWELKCKSVDERGTDLLDGFLQQALNGEHA